MSPRSFAVLVLAAASLGACAGGYAPADGDADRGFSSQAVTAQEWVVRYRGDYGMSARRAETLALRRAAEIADIRGYDWLTVAERYTRIERSLVDTLRPRLVSGGRRRDRIEGADLEAARIASETAPSAEAEPANQEGGVAAEDLNALALAERSSTDARGDPPGGDGPAAQDARAFRGVGTPDATLRVVFGVRETPAVGEAYDVDALLRVLGDP